MSVSPLIYISVTEVGLIKEGRQPPIRAAVWEGELDENVFRSWFGDKISESTERRFVPFDWMPSILTCCKNKFHNVSLAAAPVASARVTNETHLPELNSGASLRCFCLYWTSSGLKLPRNLGRDERQPQTLKSRSRSFRSEPEIRQV